MVERGSNQAHKFAVEDIVLATGTPEPKWAIILVAGLCWAMLIAMQPVASNDAASTG